jgi:CRISPR-associated protein Cmr6
MADQGRCDNFGLLLDRFVAYDARRGGLQLVREFSDRSTLVPDFSKQQELLDAYRERWRLQAETMGAATFSARPEWRTIVGLSTNAVLETGITLHPVLGLPVVPGSSLKGITRCYVEGLLDEPRERIDAQFGWLDEEQSGCGNLVFLEGCPADVPQIERDVVSPIFGQYYRGKSPPAAYLSPQPFFFLALGRASLYQFGVAALDGDREAAEQGARWLQGALQTVGVGAKTAAGYGFWVIEPSPATPD